MTLLIAGVIFAIFIFSLVGDEQGTFGMSPIVPWPAAILASAAIIISLLAILNILAKHLHQFALAGFLLLAAASAMVLFATDGPSSPFIALWMIISVFAGVFGLAGIVPLFLMVNGYLAYQFGTGAEVSRNDVVVYILAAELPLLISFLIWHNKSSKENTKEQAFSELSQELSQVSNQSDIVISSIADGVIAVDSKGAIRLINPAALKILGWEGQDAMGLDYRSVLTLLGKDDKQVERNADPVYQVFNDNKSVLNDDLSLSTHSGKKLAVSLLVSPAGGEGQGAIVVFRDITKQKREEREQAEFISTASHEMRTPVAAMEGYLGLAMNPATAVIDEKARTYLAKAHESAEHLGRLFQDLLDISRVEDGRLKNEPRPIDLVAFCGELTASFAQKTNEKQLSLMFKPSQDSEDPNKPRLNPVFYVMADPDHLREITANLIDNAIKYTKEGGIELDVLGDDEQATVSITDTGIGIAPEDLPHLFQKFYRVDNSDTREIGGTGLGLYLARRLVENMNGRIWVESKFQKGSTFYISLPRLTQEEAQAELEKVKQSSSAPAKMPSIGQLPSNMAGSAQATAQPSVATTPAPAAAPAVQPVAQPQAQPSAPTTQEPVNQPPQAPPPITQQ
jgi:PAS domain S-box-containing protein